jgi:hypothetical protein
VLPWSETPTYSYTAPTLYLPWSDAPVYTRRLPTLELPWSYLPRTRLPCTYPGAGKPAPPRLPGRLPRRTCPFFPSLSLPLPPPPRAPQGPQVSQKPPAPRLPWSSPWTPAGPLEGAANGRATWAARFGLAVQFAFSAKIICMGNRPNRLTAERAGGAYPGATLEPAGEGEGERPGEPRRRGRRTNERPRPARGETPTLEPGADLPYTSPRREGRKGSQPTKTKRTREPLRAPPREDVLGKSRRSTAYPQQIVTTRLLYCLQDRFAQLSRLQRI